MDENFNRLVMECTGCRLKFLARELKVDPVSETLKCVNCLNFPEGKVTVLKDKEPKKRMRGDKVITLPVPKKKEEKERPRLPAGYTAYKCKSCRYVFKRNESFNGVCPYCSKEKTCEVISKF